MNKKDVACTIPPKQHGWGADDNEAYGAREEDNTDTYNSDLGKTPNASCIRNTEYGTASPYLLKLQTPGNCMLLGLGLLYRTTQCNTNPTQTASGNEPKDQEAPTTSTCAVCEWEVTTKRVHCDLCNSLLHYKCERLLDHEIDKIENANNAYICNGCSSVCTPITGNLTYKTEDTLPTERDDLRQPKNRAGTVTSTVLIGLRNLVLPRQPRLVGSLQHILSSFNLQ